MNYKHLFHAGNFADVFKHIILITLIQALSRKETPFCYLETHAGAGLYDLQSEAAQKNKEFNEGIAKFYSENSSNPVISEYLSCVKKMNASDPQLLRFYPGSPLIAQYFLRTQDKMILCELQNDSYLELKKLFRNNKQVAVHQQDGYLGLKSFLPPKERRGLILIDPPYEKQEELSSLVKILKETIQRFETGVYSIWYPIKQRSLIEIFHKEIKATLTKPVLVAELSLHPEDLPFHLNGCGMLIVNPPWQLLQTLESTLTVLLDKLNTGQGLYSVKTLIN